MWFKKLFCSISNIVGDFARCKVCMLLLLLSLLPREVARGGSETAQQGGDTMHKLIFSCILFMHKDNLQTKPLEL
jgi:hypothetical protein